MSRPVLEERQGSMEVIKGIPVSPGVIIGRAFVLDDAVRFIPHRAVAQNDVP